MCVCYEGEELGRGLARRGVLDGMGHIHDFIMIISNITQLFLD